jgi:hypothetical protein
MQSRLFSRRNNLLFGLMLTAVAFGGMLLTPEPAHAQEDPQLIQCESRLEGQEAEAGALPACDLCFVFSLANNITTIAAAILGFVAALMIVVSGFQYMTAAGNEHLIETAKNTLKFAITGLIIVLVSFIIVKTAVVALLGDDSNFSIFGNIECDLPDTPEADGGTGGGTGTGNDTTGNTTTNTPTNTPPTSGKLSKQCPSGEKCTGRSFCCDASKGCNRSISPALSSAAACMSNAQVLGQPNFTYQGCHRNNSLHFGGSRCTDGAHAADYSIRPSASEGSRISAAAASCSNSRGVTILPFFEDNAGNRYKAGDSRVTHVHLEVNGASCK